MSEQERTVFIDMDSTIVDFDMAAVRDIPLSERVERGHFYIIEDYPEAVRPTIQAVYNHPDFFENLELFSGVEDAWQVLLDNGYHPRILSAPLTSNPNCIEGKKRSLEKLLVPHFGSSVVEEAIFDKDKWRHDGLVLIDDRPDIKRGPEGSDVASWEHVLFGWPHLAEVPLAKAAFRLIDWSEPDALLEILDRVRFQNK